MFNESEADEKRYLQWLLARLQRALNRMEERLSAASRDVLDAKRYLWQNAAMLDPAERAAQRVEVSSMIDIGEKNAATRDKLRKLAQSPFFGRVDFRTEDRTDAEAYYIGVHSFADEASQENLIYDWRTPVASLFYDYGVGPAAFSAPMGRVEGEVTRKRQYKIASGEMAYMIESAITINDDVLQKELSAASDEKMKNIVATIQQEQNAIIRNESANELLIQGAAGSGKTSVALHRVAFLLYRFKERLSSRHILILSPNKVFADYISNVLPELGEEPILEMGMDDLAAQALAGVCGFQRFHRQVAELLEGEDDALAARIAHKASIAFVRELDAFLAQAEEVYFEAKDVVVDGVKLDREDLIARYRALRSMPVLPRLDKMAAAIAGSARDEEGDKPSAATSRRILAEVRKMFKYRDALSLYGEFYRATGKPGLFRLRSGKTAEYADAFPLAYVKMYLEGAEPYAFVKHLLVDEMQDYTPIQYAVLAKLFPCKKTILGDGNQSVNPYSSSSLALIRQIFPRAETVELFKSYRSTLEISRFAQRLKRNDKLIPIERHGDEPSIVACVDPAGEEATIRGLIAAFESSEQRSLGVVCKTQSQADAWHARLKDAWPEIDLLSFDSERYRDGICIAPAHLAKGLEFDMVVVPSADARVYRTELDKSLLYIACTRAMHKLTLTYCGELTPFLAR
ncbi:HelD family protein [Cohnella nanjingensis]|uniref:AAA family ATPase n=1 Tax=Cohnella nanjingensis TaxID=1387779 RepID=A0A7X0RKG6_9BACL|nr:UvrD-helicase domain-containing protein [Cohnella nanjingensis]MBB6669095.1 AAA family ATPase [Cohnella nanjingensis]